MFKSVLAVGVACIVLFSTQASAGDSAKGESKAAQCKVCHGSQGVATIKTYPSLAGQNKEYLVSALKAYKLKQRSGGMAGVMQAQASGLSDADIENLAEYYSGL